ncbi:hypothetical protein FA048_11545 [Pedobacter polaris]|uniref:DUF4249 family protein n=1 Tax=Pedobacter polaris TaxID=2571273 RepID=A0A4U1CRL6_9SPHI|nr:DUF4249 family protein [Pedobacter polaris]TKC10797.1 hypothetical protein FA048_11545 [Pedobacter polaris]
MEINKNLKYLFTLIFIVIVYCFSSCQKDNAAADYARPVVEAYLIPGQALQVKVYYQKYLEDTISYGFPITGLALKVSDGTSNVSLTETKSGIYTYADANFIKDSKTYALSFSYLDKTISAQTTIPSKPANFKASSTQQEVPAMTVGSTPTTFIPVTYSWANATSDYYMLSIQNIETYPSSISRNTRLKNEVLVGQVSTYNTEAMNFSYAGNHKVLLFHINKEYNDALKNIGGNSLNLTNPSTNVINGLGIFTGLRADTLDLFVYQ